MFGENSFQKPGTAGRAGVTTTVSSYAALSVTVSSYAALSVTVSSYAALSVTVSSYAALSVTVSSYAALSVTVSSIRGPVGDGLVERRPVGDGLVERRPVSDGLVERRHVNDDAGAGDPLLDALADLLDVEDVVLACLTVRVGGLVGVGCHAVKPANAQSPKAPFVPGWAPAPVACDAGMPTAKHAAVVTAITPSGAIKRFLILKRCACRPAMVDPLLGWLLPTAQGLSKMRAPTSANLRVGLPVSDRCRINSSTWAIKERTLLVRSARPGDASHAAIVIVIDPRDTEWEVEGPVYRVYFWHQPPAPWASPKSAWASTVTSTA